MPNLRELIAAYHQVNKRCNDWPGHSLKRPHTPAHRREWAALDRAYWDALHAILAYPPQDVAEAQRKVRFLVGKAWLRAGNELEAREVRLLLDSIVAMAAEAQEDAADVAAYDAAMGELAGRAWPIGSLPLLKR